MSFTAFFVFDWNRKCLINRKNFWVLFQSKGWSAFLRFAFITFLEKVIKAKPRKAEYTFVDNTFIQLWPHQIFKRLKHHSGCWSSWKLELVILIPKRPSDQSFSILIWKQENRKNNNRVSLSSHKQLWTGSPRLRN